MAVEQSLESILTESLQENKTFVVSEGDARQLDMLVTLARQSEGKATLGIETGEVTGAACTVLRPYREAQS